MPSIFIDLPLTASEQEWTAGTWYVLLPNIMLTLTRRYNKGAYSNENYDDHGFDPIITSFALKQYGEMLLPNFYEKNDFASEKAIKTYQEILHSMRHLFNVFIFSKIYSEKNKGQDGSEAMLLDLLSNTMSNMIIDTYFDTFVITVGKGECPVEAVCEEAKSRENFDSLHSIFLSVDDKLVTKLEQELGHGYCRNVVIGLIKSIKANDFAKYSGILHLRPCAETELSLNPPMLKQDSTAASAKPVTQPTVSDCSSTLFSASSEMTKHNAPLMTNDVSLRTGPRINHRTDDDDDENGFQGKRRHKPGLSD